MKIKRKIVQIDEERCDGCGQCVIGCAEGALALVDGKVRVISDNLCDGLGACIGECPQGALKIVEREAEAFDEEAVESHLATQATQQETRVMACGCPSSQIQSFCPPPADPATSASAGRTASKLTHWPVQIRLIPPDAPFLKGADLLVVADCVPVALPTLHQDFLQGKAVMIGCPKFDDPQQYVEKFAAIFKTAGIRSITTVVMEVPCCSGLPRIVQKGLEAAGTRIPLTQIVVGTRGQILDQHRLA